MVRSWSTVLKLLVLLLAVPELASAVRVGRLIGKVVNPEGKPVAGVTVTATAKELPRFNVVRTTNKKGVFKVDFERINVVYQYRFEKTGFQTTVLQQNWSFEGTKRHKFTIEPGAAPAPRGASQPPPPPPASTSNPAILAFNSGAAAFRAGDHEVARVELEEAVRHDSNLRQAWELLSAVHLELTHYQNSVDAAERAIALGSTDVLALRSRWQAYSKLGDEAKTAEAWEDLERLGRMTEEANRIYNEGVALKTAGDPVGAFAKFQEAIKADPNHALALFAIASTGLEVDQTDAVMAATEKLLAANPQHEEALRIRFNASLKLGDEAKLLDALVGLARVEPVGARDRLFQLAEEAYDADDLVAAKNRLEKVLEVDPNHPRSHYLLGLLLMREGAKNEARAHVERFIDLAPEDADAGTAAEIVKHLGGS